MTYHFATGRTDEAKQLVLRHHYSRRWPSNVQLVATWHEDGGLFGWSGDAVAACVFSIPPTRWSEPVLELIRLVRAPHCAQPLSGLIAQTCDHIRRRRAADLLVSFADSTVGHHGGIYRACSWNYHGKREARMDGCIINGRFVPGRTLNSLYGTQSPDKLRAKGLDVRPHYDEGKHLYWRALSKSGRRKAARLGLRSSSFTAGVEAA